MSRPRKPAPPRPPALPPAPPPPLPEWFEAPPHDEREGRSHVHHSSELAYHLIDQLEAGRLVLPTWQRGAAWGGERRLALLDSMVRGLPIGSVVLWRPHQEHECRAFPGTKAAEHIGGWDSRAYVIDGQQRLTTLLMSARDEVSAGWNGQRGGVAGFVRAALALRVLGGRAVLDHVSAAQIAGFDIIDPLARVIDKMARAVIPCVIFEHYTEEEMRAAYQRLAHLGVAHDARPLADVLDQTAIPTWDLSPPRAP